MMLFRMILDKPGIYLSEIQDELMCIFGVYVCVSTICRTLKIMGWRNSSHAVAVLSSIVAIITPAFIEPHEHRQIIQGDFSHESSSLFIRSLKRYSMHSLSSAWWMLALSIITTDRGLVPLNGMRTGRRESCTNLANLSSFMLPSAMYTSCTPTTDIMGMAE